MGWAGESSRCEDPDLQEARAHPLLGGLNRGAPRRYKRTRQLPARVPECARMGTYPRRRAPDRARMGTQRRRPRASSRASNRDAARRAASLQTPAVTPIRNRKILNHIAGESLRQSLDHSDASALGSGLAGRAKFGLGSPNRPPILGIAFLSPAHPRQAPAAGNPHPEQANPCVSIGATPLSGVRGVFVAAWRAAPRWRIAQMRARGGIRPGARAFVAPRRG